MKPKTGASFIVVGIVLAALGLLWLISSIADGDPSGLPAGILVALVLLAPGVLLLVGGLRRRQRLLAGHQSQTE